MKYWIEEKDNGTHRLIRRGQEVGLPNNPELLFWLYLKEAAELLKKVKEVVAIDAFNPTPIEEPDPDGPWIPVGLLNEINTFLQEFNSRA